MKLKSCTHRDHKGPRDLPLSQFSKHPGMRDGRQSICRECNKRLAYARAARLSRERRALKGQEPLEVYRRQVRDMIYREPPLDYAEAITPDILLEDL